MKEKHWNCSYNSLQAIVSKVLNKRKQLPTDLKAAVDKLDKKYLEIIEALSIDREALQVWTENFGLNDCEVKLIDFLKNGLSSKINGEMVHKINKDIKKSQVV